MSIHIPVKGLPITADDATIARALEEASIPTLIMSMVHMSGDAAVLDGPIRPQGCYLNEVQGFMAEDDKAMIRAQALEVIKAYRDRGCTLPPPPSVDTLQRMMSFLVAEPVPADYVPMMLEEMELDGEDQRAFRWDKPVDPEVLDDFHVVVIGGGMSGLLAAIRLKEAGIPFTVFEKNPGVGGTWWENRYPGCRVDVGNHFYCYSFAPNAHWSRYFATQPELQRYFEDCMDQFGVRENFRFNTEVSAAHFDDDSQRWRVTVRNAAGQQETLEAGAVISAVGQLNRPKMPDIPGIERFRGDAFHSARWPEQLDLRGKRVAVIGTGASAFQIVPTIAPEVAQLSVFQRSAPWMFPNPDYHAEVGEGKKWCLQHLPYYSRWYRFLIFWPGCDGVLPALRIDPEWKGHPNAVSETHEFIRQMFTDYLVQQVGDDEELLRKVIPDYVTMGKRTLQDNGSWLASLKRDNVELVDDPIREITERGVVTESDRCHEVDIIVFATGFHANRFLWPMDITGRGGVSLREQWGDSPSAYLGITVPNFPNLFCLYGPGTNLAHGGSLIFHSECEVRYTMGCIKAVLERGRRTIECTPEAHDAYMDKLRAELAGMVWSHPSITRSWYKNQSGQVTVLSPWRLLDFWRWTRQPDMADYRLS